MADRRWDNFAFNDMSYEKEGPLCMIPSYGAHPVMGMGGSLTSLREKQATATGAEERDTFIGMRRELTGLFQ